MGDRKEFFCLENMKFVGDYKESVCLESGHWSNPIPKCLAPCIVPRVEHSLGIYIVPPDVQVQNMTNVTLNSAEPGTQVDHGSFLEIVCVNNYELEEQIEGSSLVLGPMCDREKWTSTPKCRPASCQSTPPSPKNGRVKIVSMEHGSKGYIHCLDGFKLKGDSATTCLRGNWTSLNTSCNEIYCGFPGIIEHGRVLLIGLTGMYDYKPYIRRISNNRQIAYECEVGYRMSDGAPSGATCMDGLWRPEGLPTCIKEI